MEEMFCAEGRGLGEDEGVGSGTEVINRYSRQEGGEIDEGHGNDWR